MEPDSTADERETWSAEELRQRRIAGRRDPASSRGGRGGHPRRGRADAATAGERAERLAQERIAELTAEAERTRRDADDYASDVRVAVDSFASQERRDAAQEAERSRAAAQEEARAMREAAEAMAQDIASRGASPRRELRQEIRLLDDRRVRVVEGLRDFAAQLEDVLVRPSAGALEPFDTADRAR